MTNERTRRVAFADVSIKEAFLKLQKGKFEEKQLSDSIRKTIDELKKDPFAGVAIPRKLWPKEYVKKFGIDNLRKCNLPNGWRLIYTLQGNQVEIVSIILEWFGHKDYEKRFKYKVK